jgi:hypothetical protein
MVIYKCDDCKKKFKQRIDWLRHRRRKIPCTGVVVGGNYDERIAKLETKVRKIKFLLEDLIEKVDKLTGEGKDEKIKIKDFLDFKERIEPEKHIQIIEKSQSVSNMILLLTEESFFNKKFPERHSIYLKRKTDDKVEIFTDDNWKSESLEEMLEDIANEMQTQALAFFNKNKEKINKQGKKNISALEEIRRPDYDKTLLRKIKNIVYENRDIVKKTKKLHDK